MGRGQSVAIDGAEVRILFTDRTDGDLRIRPSGPASVEEEAVWTAEVSRRRRSLVDRPWTWLRQVHGSRAVLVERPGGMAGAEADAALTAHPGAAVAVSVADCAPVILVSEAGVAAVHAGWRGLVGGVVANAASQLRAVAGSPVAAVLGPCIGPGAYEFGAEDLDRAAAVLGDAVRGRTGWDTPALDVPAAVAVACEQAGWPPPDQRPACTSDPAYFSHRTRVDTGRQVGVAWIEPGGR